jgi:phosphotransferase system HPr-like phosphotransfer protein
LLVEGVETGGRRVFGVGTLRVAEAVGLGVLNGVVGEVTKHRVKVPLSGATSATSDNPNVRVVGVKDGGEVELEVSGSAAEEVAFELSVWGPGGARAVGGGVLSMSDASDIGRVEGVLGREIRRQVRLPGVTGEAKVVSSSPEVKVEKVSGGAEGLLVDLLVPGVREVDSPLRVTATGSDGRSVVGKGGVRVSRAGDLGSVDGVVGRSVRQKVRLPVKGAVTAESSVSSVRVLGVSGDGEVELEVVGEKELEGVVELSAVGSDGQRVFGRGQLRVSAAADIGGVDAPLGQVTRHRVHLPVVGASTAEVSAPGVRVVGVTADGEVELEVNGEREVAEGLEVSAVGSDGHRVLGVGRLRVRPVADVGEVSGTVGQVTRRRVSVPVKGKAVSATAEGPGVKVVGVSGEGEVELELDGAAEVEGVLGLEVKCSDGSRYFGEGSVVVRRPESLEGL